MCAEIYLSHRHPKQSSYVSSLSYKNCLPISSVLPHSLFSPHTHVWEPASDFKGEAPKVANQHALVEFHRLLVGRKTVDIKVNISV